MFFTFGLPHSLRSHHFTCYFFETKVIEILLRKTKTKKYTTSSRQIRMEKHLPHPQAEILPIHQYLQIKLLFQLNNELTYSPHAEHAKTNSPLESWYILCYWFLFGSTIDVIFFYLSLIICSLNFLVEKYYTVI